MSSYEVFFMKLYWFHDSISTDTILGWRCSKVLHCSDWEIEQHLMMSFAKVHGAVKWQGWTSLTRLL